MPDDSNDPPFDDNTGRPEPDPGSDAASPDAELDELLARAGELADRLSTELGVDESDDISGQSGGGPEPPAEDQPSLEDELAHLEQLVEATSNDVGRESEPSAPPEATDDSTAPQTRYVAHEDLVDVFERGNVPPPVPPEIIEQTFGPGAARPATVDDEAIGDAPPVDDETPTSAPSEPDEQNPPTYEVDDDIPDFMREFTEPAPEPASEPESEASAVPRDAAPAAALPEAVIETTPVPVQTKPGVVGTGLLQKLVKTAGLAEPEADHEETPEAPSRIRGPLELAHAVLRRLAAIVRHIGLLAPLAGRLAYQGCDFLLNLLERADRPIERYGWRARVLIGWVAMATFGTSVVVYVISMF